MRFCIAITASLMLQIVGCASQRSAESYEREIQQEALQTFEIMTGWIGGPVDRLIMAKGPPTDVFELANGYRIYTWEDASDPFQVIRWRTWSDDDGVIMRVAYEFPPYLHDSGFSEGAIEDYADH